MFGAVIRAAERWRAIRVSELERRQMCAVREELDYEYEAQNGLGTKASAPAPQDKYAAHLGLDPSDVQINVVCTLSKHRMTGMYHFCHRYKPGESNPPMIFLREDNKAEVLMPVKSGHEMSQFIRDSERRRTRNLKTA